MNKSPSSLCLDNQSKVYIQYKCEYSHVIAKQRDRALMIAAIGVSISFMFIFSIYYLRYSSSITLKEWDINIVTAADFTVEIDITERLWRKWIKRIDSQMNDLKKQRSRVLNESTDTLECKEPSFREFLKDEITQQLENAWLIHKG